MKVSIIIPTYNSENHLLKCLDSIVNQTYKNLEIIIVNDGSTDNTENLVKGIGKTDGRINLISQTNCGIYKSRRNGYSASSGDVILNIDSDDYLELNAVELLVKKMISESADIVIGNHLHHEFNMPRKVSNEIPENVSKQSLISYFLLGKIRGYLWGKLFKRHLLENIDLPIKVSLTEDVLTNFHILINHNIRIALVNEVILNYIIHGANATKSSNKEIIESVYDHLQIIENMLIETNLINELKEQFAAYNCRNWIVYCRMGGLKNKTKRFVKTFHEKNYSIASSYLNLQQRVEMLAYSKSLFLGNLVTKLTVILKKIYLKVVY